MKVFILSASAAAFWHKIGKGCNVDIIMIEVEKGGGGKVEIVHSKRV